MRRRIELWLGAGGLGGAGGRARSKWFWGHPPRRTLARAKRPPGLTPRLARPHGRTQGSRQSPSVPVSSPSVPASWGVRPRQLGLPLEGVCQRSRDFGSPSVQILASGHRGDRSEMRRRPNLGLQGEVHQRPRDCLDLGLPVLSLWRPTSLCKFFFVFFRERFAAAE